MAVAASVFAAGQAEIVAQHPQKHPLGVQIGAHGPAVELELHGFCHRGSPFLMDATR